MTAVPCIAVIPVTQQWIINYNNQQMDTVAEVYLHGDNPGYLSMVFDLIMGFLKDNNFNRILNELHSFGRNVVLQLQNGKQMTYCSAVENWILL